MSGMGVSGRREGSDVFWITDRSVNSRDDPYEELKSSSRKIELKDFNTSTSSVRGFLENDDEYGFPHEDEQS